MNSWPTLGCIRTISRKKKKNENECTYSYQWTPQLDTILMTLTSIQGHKCVKQPKLLFVNYVGGIWECHGEC